MLNAWKIAVTAALGTGFTAGATNDIKLADADIPTALAQEAAGKTSQRVSVEFQNASVGEVLQWLTHKGINFVAAESEVDRDAKITLNVEDAPLGDVVNSIAAALGGHWERQGEMRVFRKGIVYFGDSRGNGYTGRSFMTPGDVQVYGWSKEDQAKFQKQMEEFRKNMKDFQYSVPKVDVERMRELRGARPDVRVWSYPPMSKEEAERFRKDMEQFRKGRSEDQQRAWKELERNRGRNLTPEEREKLDKEIRVEVERAMKESEKAMEELRKNGFYAPGGESRVWYYGNGSKFVAPKIDGRYWKDAPQISINGGNGYVSLMGGDLQRLVRGLTPEQLEKHRRQGYLSPKDLTSSQRKLLGVQGDGDWTIVFKADGRNITFKNR